MVTNEDEMGIEESVIDAFRDTLSKTARERGLETLALSLNSQDRKTGADYLLSANDRFSFVEFKSYERSIRDEKEKPLRLHLCRSINRNTRMRSFHDSAHFIAWADAELVIYTNIYRHEVCNHSVFGANCGLRQALPSVAQRKPAASFIMEFLSGQNSLSLDRFEAYLSWLLEDVAVTGRGSLVLFVTNPVAQICGLLRFNSVEALFEWIKKQKPEPTAFDEPSQGPEPRR
ncbi:MAG: hypothetical protein QE284_19890 [Rhizobium sp.]|nr:hypothetical protein [Rhizobium sp.]